VGKKRFVKLREGLAARLKISLKYQIGKGMKKGKVYYF